MFKKILVTIDGSDPAKLAFDFGVGLADRDGAELVVLTVVPPYPSTSRRRGNSRTIRGSSTTLSNSMKSCWPTPPRASRATTGD